MRKTKAIDPQAMLTAYPIALRPETLSALRADLKPVEKLFERLSEYAVKRVEVCQLYAERDSIGAPKVIDGEFELRSDGIEAVRALEEEYKDVLRKARAANVMLERLVRGGTPTRHISALGVGQTRPWSAVVVDCPEAPLEESKPDLDMEQPDRLALLDLDPDD